ncbi:UNKNOWN [Stylonychia lemnae]|uniref:Uncharacterized protein n=1 Tax=Stylonychia lemnae TaxID=5949 RepID=A0A078A042_STYLE|nr:UNKNOWN [Stylonychia lemnae]|eukprot:CDW74143.1 UNKNOWN [Stylonychia lemnae]
MLRNVNREVRLSKNTRMRIGDAADENEQYNDQENEGDIGVLAEDGLAEECQEQHDDAEHQETAEELSEEDGEHRL